MKLFYTDIDGVTKRYVYEVFGESGKLTYGVVDSSGSAETVNLSDLVTYQNWKKE
jgi:hypothetical protein